MKEIEKDSMKKAKLGQGKCKCFAALVFIYMPKFWVSYRGIKRGDVMQIDLLPDGALKISPVEGA